MAHVFLERLRSARKIEIFAAIVIVSLIALQGLNGWSAPESEKSELELRLESILSRIDGAGQVDAMITQREDGGITGVVVLADGIADVQTYLNVQRAVQTLLDIDLAQIQIIGGTRQFGGGA